MIKRAISILKHLSRSNSTIPYKLRNVDDGDDFDCALLFDFFEKSKIPFIPAIGEYHAAFKFGNDTMEAYDIGNAGLVSRHILKNYIDEDYQVLFSRFCAKYVNLMAFIDVVVSMSKKGCLFNVNKNAKSLENIRSYSTFYKTYFFYDERYSITKTKFEDDFKVLKEVCITLNFNGESSYLETGTSATINIDYYNQEKFLLKYY